MSSSGASPRVFSTSVNEEYWGVTHSSSAYMKPRVPLWIGWSLVYMLNRIGERTLRWGKLFFCFLHLLRSLFSFTYNLLLDSMFSMFSTWMVVQGFVVDLLDEDPMVHCVISCRQV